MISAFGICEAQGKPVVSSDSTSSPVGFQMKLPITLKAQNANLADILKALADHSGMNFVTGDITAKEKISILLNSTPLDEAIDLIVRAAGLSYEVIGNSVLVADPDKLNKGEVGQQGYVVTLEPRQCQGGGGDAGEANAEYKGRRGRKPPDLLHQPAHPR